MGRKPKTLKLDSRIHINNAYFCHGCLFLFSLHTTFKNGGNYPYCPKCGDYVDVKKYKQPPNDKYKPWTTKEVQLLDRIIAGELKVYQVAAKTNRSIVSVQKKLMRRRAGQVKKSTGKEILMLDKTTKEPIQGFKSIKEAAQQMGVATSSISKALESINKSSCGYSWAYRSEYDKTKTENLER